jgi:gamma-glutamylcyclotransferase
MKYFAYGSNLLNARLLSRCPDAGKIGSAFLTGYTWCFDKRSSDGSGKCTIRQTGNTSDVVHGVLFNIPQPQVPCLDLAEGEGVDYDRVPIQVQTMEGGVGQAETYIAREAKIDRNAKPYNWYLNLIVTGAELHGLPKAYVDRLRQVQTMRDPWPERPERLKALKQLDKST